jgi:secondary thiamine-phosphate synthase enzyme
MGPHPPQSGRSPALGASREGVPGPTFLARLMFPRIMVAYLETISLETTPGPQAIDITHDVHGVISKSHVRDGLACVFTPSSTSAIVTNEFEPGLMEEDIPKALERVFPERITYGHERRWHDGNGHSHVRATFLGPSLTIPIVDGQAALGTWQQVVFLELDNKPRHREVIVQVVGEGGKPRG